MSFLYPNFLYALSAIIIPIIIHLFNFITFKTVYFSNIAFLKNIQKQTKSQSKIKHLLILLSRILAISALVFAFAQPFIPSGESKETGKEIIGIYVDNSFSMQAESKYGKLSDMAGSGALSILKSYKPGTEFIYCDNNLDSKSAGIVSAENVKTFISGISASANTLKLSTVLSRMNDISLEENQNESKIIYLVSDFAQNICDFENFPKLENTKVVLIPVISQTENNIFIDSVWFESPNRLLNQPDEILVKITNISEQSYQNIPLKLFINDTLKSPASFNIEANSSKVEKLVFTNSTPGIVRGRVEITDYPITYDNTFYFSFDISKQRKILLASKPGSSKFITNLFVDKNYFLITETDEKNIKAPEFRNYDVIILSSIQSFSGGLIQDFVNFISGGGTGIIFCSDKPDIESYNTLFNKLSVNYIAGIDTNTVSVDFIDYSADIYKNAFTKIEKSPDLPKVYRRVKFGNLTNTTERTLLATSSNDKILSQADFGMGKVYIFSQPADLKSTNFVKNPLWAPSLYNPVSFGNSGDKNFYTIGEDNIILLRTDAGNDKEMFKMTGFETKIDFIPKVLSGSQGAIRLSPEDNIKNHGIYIVSKSNINLKGTAFNFNRQESDIKHFDSKELEKKITDLRLENFSINTQENDFLSQDIKNVSKGFELWQIFILLCLLFLAAEIILVRFLQFKH